MASSCTIYTCSLGSRVFLPCSVGKSWVWERHWYLGYFLPTSYYILSCGTIIRAAQDFLLKKLLAGEHHRPFSQNFFEVSCRGDWNTLLSESVLLLYNVTPGIYCYSFLVDEFWAGEHHSPLEHCFVVNEQKHNEKNPELTYHMCAAKRTLSSFDRLMDVELDRGDLRPLECLSSSWKLTLPLQIYILKTL